MHVDSSTTGAQPASLHLVHAQILELQSTGFTSAPETIHSAALAGPWLDVRLPHAQPLHPVRQAAQLTDGSPPTTITWYRLQTQVLAHVAAPRYLYIPRWKTIGRISVYADSRLLYQSHARLLSFASNHPLWIPLDNDGRASGPHVILIRVQHMRDIDAALSSVWIGTEAALGWRYQTREWLQAQLPAMGSAAILAIGLFASFVWIGRRHETLYLLCALMSVAAYLRTLQDFIVPDWLPVSDAWFGWLAVNSRFWVVSLVHLFLVHLHRRKQPWLTCVMLGTVTASSLLTLPLLPGLPVAPLVAPLMFIVLLVAGNVAFASGARNAWLSHSRDGLVLAGWSLLGTQLGLHDWLLENNLINIEGMFLGSYVSIGAFMIFTYAMFRHHTRALDEVAQVNANLERRLQMREAELSESYQRLREVEQREMISQERRRMMQDMHDSVGASLICALGVVERSEFNPTAIAEMLRGCVEDLKLAIDSMEPVEADLLLLLATLRFRIGPRLKSMGMDLRWEIREVPPLIWLDPGTSLHILRILQEVFANIVKHAAASEIRVATATEQQGVVVSIIDNGHGFMPEQAERDGGRGLRNQMYRAAAIGARIRWESGDHGTRFFLWLPEQRTDKQ